MPMISFISMALDMRRSEDVQEVLGSSYVRSIYIMCPKECFPLFCISFAAEYCKALQLIGTDLRRNCVKYARIQIFFGPYFPVLGKYASEKTLILAYFTQCGSIDRLNYLFWLLEVTRFGEKARELNNDNCIPEPQKLNFSLTSFL